jgi:hypothetical protein
MRWWPPAAATFAFRASATAPIRIRFQLWTPIVQCSGAGVLLYISLRFYRKVWHFHHLIFCLPIAFCDTQWQINLLFQIVQCFFVLVIHNFGGRKFHSIWEQFGSVACYCLVEGRQYLPFQSVGIGRRRAHPHNITRKLVCTPSILNCRSFWFF